MANPKVVAVTGASGYIGQRVVQRLLGEPAIERVIGINVRPSAIEHPKLLSTTHDITDSLDDIFVANHVEAVVHLAFVMRQDRNRLRSRTVNVGGSTTVLRACEAASVKRIVLLSSSTVYGAHPENKALITELAPLRPPEGFDYATDKVAVERLFDAYAADHADVDLTTLRSCVVMGPNVSNFITQALDKPVLVGVGTADPGMQFVHEEDLVEIIWRCVSESHPGKFNVAGPGAVPWSRIARMAGKRVVRLPAPMAYGITNISWMLRLQSDAPGVGLNWIRWPWRVSTARLHRELDFEFRHTSLAALESCFTRDGPGAGQGLRPGR